MRSIWKFPLEVVDSQDIELPLHAQPLAVQMQGDKPCLWAIVETNAPKVTRTIYIYGTGTAPMTRSTRRSTLALSR